MSQTQSRLEKLVELYRAEIKTPITDRDYDILDKYSARVELRNSLLQEIGTLTKTETGVISAAFAGLDAAQAVVDAIMGGPDPFRRRG